MSGEILSTYRLQLNPAFTFDDVAAIAGYFADLGITHLYLSPYFEAAPGSRHGYDIVDPTRLSEALGGRAGFDRMVAALDANGLSHIADIVPNHLSIEGNEAWWDVLKGGRESDRADRFDIDWDDLDGKVCAPLLGDDLKACLKRGEISLDTSADEPVIRYFDHILPVAPTTDLAAPIEDIVEAQNYWLVEWRRGNRNLNYRRFADVSTLAAVRVERDTVFEATHQLVLSLVSEGAVTGLRIDHIDGLLDPQGYLERLEARVDVPLWVEKILAGDEELPAGWPVEGTTGYDFLDLVGGLFLDPEGEGLLTETYARVTGQSLDLPGLAHLCKMLVMRQVLLAEVKRLYREVEAIVGPFETEDEEGHMMGAIAETLAAFDVYRTYVRPDGTHTTTDESLLLDALETARGHGALVPAGAFEKLADVLLSGEGGEAARALLLRLQQTTGPVMAKSIEDTLFYRFNRLISLNEVGRDPGYFGTSVDEFHDRALHAVQVRPRSMLATSTHDTKRSEDVRSRLALLTEIPERWAEAVARWEDMAARHLHEDPPGPNLRYLLYQTLVGAHPLETERARTYMLKAAREAKEETSWLYPNETYESALDRFVKDLLSDVDFVADLDAFVAPLIEPGRVNSLAQTLIRFTYPGLPDTYQGSEVWDLSLVDPDNRRAVDFGLRSSLLAHVDETDAAELWAVPDDGGPKMLVTTRALHLRLRMPQVFSSGSYTPIAADGEAAAHAVAYLRGDEVAVVVPRLVIGLGGDWGDTTIPLAEGAWHNELTGERIYGGNVSLQRLLDHFPVALLSRA